jgi:tetratricopeptide (TPR) repeat protein
MKKNIGFGGRIALTAVLAGLALQGRADQLIMKNKTVMEAKSIRFKPSTQEYIVITEESTVPVPAKNVERAVVPKPAALDKAAADITAGKYADAIAPLETIVSEMAGLEWDNVARDLLGQALLGKKDARKAVATYKEIVDTLPPERVLLLWRRHYWESLKAAEMFAVLKVDLEKVISAGSRDTAALAQLMRGDMYAAQGQKNEALLDYLRTVILYEKVVELQPEALYKSAVLLDELRDPRAAELKKKLAQDYGASPYAKKMTGG